VRDEPERPPRPTPHLDLLEARFRSASPVFREAVARPRAAFGDEWADEFDETIERLLPGNDDIALAVDGYSRFALDVLRLQARFDLTGAYESRTYADVARDVYANDEYMRTCYLPGLLLSQYLWPHHHRQARFFEREFLGDMRRAGAEQFYDVGVGTGFYSRLGLVALPRVNGVGFDISPSSRDYAEHHAGAFDAADRYRVELRDVVLDPPKPVDWLVSVEVLEHLEDPVEFIRALRGLLRPGGKAFIATALNAPNADHIYLYRTAGDVISQLREGGFSVEQYSGALAGKPSRSDMPAAEVAAFIVT
jgi:SAM-dependent methyltransferase